MKKYKIFVFSLLVFLLTFYGSCPKILDIGSVPLPEVEQETDYWCWAGSMQAIFSVFSKNVSQCVQANWLFGHNDCCNSTVPSHCIRGATGSQQLNVLKHWGLDGILVSTTITWAQLKAEIDAGRPINMGWSWCSGGGHSLDIYGFSEIENGTITRNVWYMDPWHGEGYNVAEYSWVVGGCPGDHRWYRTIYNIHE